ncbi:hypothetical protein LguiA_017796 [Lonicera macranthoides]
MELAAVEFTIMTINSVLKKKFLVVGIRHEITELKVELESMRSFLRVANKCNNDQNESFDFWVAQVRDAAYKAEDVIDEFVYHIEDIRGRDGGFKGFFHRFLHFPKEIYVRFFTAFKFYQIKEEIKEIATRSKRYDIGHIEEGSSSDPTPKWVQNIEESSFFVKENEVVGKERERSMLLRWLMDEEEPQRAVVSVVGMGGLGKTTLVANAYNDHEVKRFFDCFAWVTVSQNYVIEDLLRRLIIDFCYGKNDQLAHFDLKTMGYKQLAETLVQVLQKKRYVVVLDDVWTDNIWMQINVALPDGKNGSRVIISTRKEDVAMYPFGVTSHVLHSQPLTEDQAWTLFCNKTFSNEPEKACPPDLEDIARDMVKRCAGLPLAIVALGGLMASKERSELKWRAVHNSIEWHWRDNPRLEVVKTILFLSFHDLPYCLKKCFLYCCRFPEGDYWVGGGRLIRMWVAEGFVEERKGFTPEEVGKSYLKELISRSLLQVRKSNTLLGAKQCRLHDLMRELALFISDKENFSSIYDLQAGIENERRPRRLCLLHPIDGSTPMFAPNMSHVRSFAAFNFCDNPTLSLDSFLSSFRLLRVLELRDAPIDHVTTTIGKLFNLRYLNLSRTRLKELPESMWRLRNLQTLDIRETNIEELPSGMHRLRKMRHLLTYCTGRMEEFEYIVGKRVSSTISKLKSLQVVNCIEANDEIIKRISKLTQLKRIQLTNVRETDGIELCSSIGKMKLLRHLLVMATNENEFLALDALPHSSIPPVLRKLTLVGRLKRVPSWFPLLRNIIYLHLHWSQLAEEDPIQYINGLPNLEHLALVNAYDRGKVKLCFYEGFPKLQDLFLVIFHDLGEIIIANGVMPSLVRMKLHVCGELKKVPRGIEHLTKLEELGLKDVSHELIDSIRGEQSVDYAKVKHIPAINHSYKINGRYEYESLSRA